MISEVYQVLKGSSSFTPSVSATYQLAAPIKVHAPVGRGGSCTIQYRKPILYGRTQKVEAEQPKFTELITSTPTPITTASPKSSDAQTGSSFTTSNPNKGKGIATGNEDSPLKFKKASKKVRQDPDEAALIDFQLHDGIEIRRMAVKEVKSVDALVKGGKTS
ncbi:hypothetical protein Tco_1333667 [Tanacetum coccineum]